MMANDLNKRSLCPYQENVSKCNYFYGQIAFIIAMCFNNKLTPFISGNGFPKLWINTSESIICRKLPYEYIYYICEQSMINRLSNPINRNRSAAKSLKVMSSNGHAIIGLG